MKLDLEKTICCFCCASGPISVMVGLPVTGYVSGQVIPITCDCDNASSVTVDKIEFTLRKVIAFHTTQPRRVTKKDKAVIKVIAVGPVNARDSQNWVEKLEIPPLPPSNLVNCGIIDLDYELKVIFT